MRCCTATFETFEEIGISTDLASIVFSDEADILQGSDDPDLEYNRLIRPGKSRLGLLYLAHAGSPVLDLRIIALTLLSALDRGRALQRVAHLVRQSGGQDHLARLALRADPLAAAPPPGASEMIASANYWRR